MYQNAASFMFEITMYFEHLRSVPFLKGIKKSLDYQPSKRFSALINRHYEAP